MTSNVLENKLKIKIKDYFNKINNLERFKPKIKKSKQIK
jgi:hypothetical protein